MTTVYIARDEYDDDDDAEQQFNPAGPSQTNGVTANEDGEDQPEYDEQDYEEEYGEDEYYEEEEEEEEVMAETPARPVKPVSDVDDLVYYDHTSLMRCWTSALSDYKFLHPSSFLPLTEAPRSKKAKHLAAPLWYGPLPLVGASSTSGRSPSIVSTSTTTTNMNGGASSFQNMTASQKRNAKKRARRDRLAAQQAQVVGEEEENSASADALEGGGKRRRVALREDSPEEPSWTPQSPGFQRDASVEAGEIGKVETVEEVEENEGDQEPTGGPIHPPPALARDSTRTRTLPTAAGPSPPSLSTSASSAASSFLPYLTEPSSSTSSLLPNRRTHSSRTPTTFPPPPPIVALDPQTITSVRAERLEAARQKKLRGLRKAQGGEVEDEEVEAEGEDESEQGLLQSALWAWYTAGYQTALYHAAVGVAGATE